MKTFCLLLLMSLSFLCGATEVINTTEDRIYVLPEQVMITDTGIYLISSDEILPITQLNADSQGIYIYNAKGGDYIVSKTCTHPKCLKCQGCLKKGCFFYCNCKSKRK